MTSTLNDLLSDPLRLLLFAVGVFGWWRLIARDSIFASARHWFFMHWPHEGFVDTKSRPLRGQSVFSSGVWYTQSGTFLGELVYCPFCLSWWLAIAQFGVYHIAPTAVMALCVAHSCRILSGFLAKHA
jgi:hypothetical protein